MLAQEQRYVGKKTIVEWYMKKRERRMEDNRHAYTMCGNYLPCSVYDSSSCVLRLRTNFQTCRGAKNQESAYFFQWLK